MKICFCVLRWIAMLVADVVALILFPIAAAASFSAVIFFGCFATIIPIVIVWVICVSGEWFHPTHGFFRTLADVVILAPLKLIGTLIAVIAIASVLDCLCAIASLCAHGPVSRFIRWCIDSYLERVERNMLMDRMETWERTNILSDPDMRKELVRLKIPLH